MSNIEYLSLLVEEASEVIQAAMKIQRFGADRIYPDGKHANETNTEALAMEVGDFLEVLGHLDLPKDVIKRGQDKKRKQLEKWGPQVAAEQLDAGIRKLRKEL